MVAHLKILQVGAVAVLAIAAMLGFTMKASAQTLADVRADLESLFADITLFNQALSQIGHDANLVLKKCRFARSAISRKKFFLNGLVLNTINAAISEANILDSNLDLLDDPGSAFDDFDQGVTDLQTDVLAVGLHATRLAAVLSDLAQISATYIPEIQSEILDLQSKSSDLLDILDDAQSDATPPGDLFATRTDLNECIVLLRMFDSERRTIVISKKSPILRLLNEIRGLLRQTGPLASSELAVVVESQRASEMIKLERSVASFRVQVYSTNGKLLLNQEASGSQFALSTAELANGAYFYVLTARGPDGRVLSTALKKFLVRH
jgi:hypothetical protein